MTPAESRQAGWRVSHLHPPPPPTTTSTHHPPPTTTTTPEAGGSPQSDIRPTARLPSPPHTLPPLGSKAPMAWAASANQKEREEELLLCVWRFTRQLGS